MVIDFGELKKIVNQEIVDVLDHSIILNKKTNHIKLANFLIEEGHKITLVDYQPTTEMMVIDFAEKISALLPQHVKLHSLKLRETATSYAEWHASDNE